MPQTSSLLHAWSQTLHSGATECALIDAASAQSWTRRELDAATNAWCDQQGETISGQVVALAEPNGAEWLRSFLAVLKSNAVIAPLDPGEPLETQRTTAEAIGANFLWREGRLESLGRRKRKPRDARRLIKLTSGSTGTPRPIFFKDGELIADGRQLCAVMGIRADDINLGLIPWGHSYGLGNLIMPLFLQGTCIVFGAPPLPHAIARAIQQWKPTIFPAVPALLRALVDSVVPPDQLASLRTVISAGAPLAPETAQNFHKQFGRKIHNFYGSSETGGISYDSSGDSAALGRGVGLPIPGVRVEFERSGRFTVANGAVFTIGNRRGGSHRMPDIGRLDERGELVLLGRAGRFVKIAGRRLNLAEVEAALKRLPGVGDAMVAPHSARADALAAAVLTARSGSEIREALRGRLSPWKIPKKILTFPAFPLTSRGKTDARRLRELLGAP